MTQDEKDKSDNVKVLKTSGDKRSKSRRGRVLKVVIRRLPPSMCEDDFVEQVSPLPEHDSFYFVPADNSMHSSMSGHSFSRAYIAFRDHQEVVNFRDKWDGYVFLDERGQDYPAIVEFAPFQKMPRKKPKKADIKNGTIEQDAEFQKFIETMDVEEEVDLPSLEATVEELERRDRELRANNGVPNVVTPLIEFVLAKKMEKVRMREERREEKKRKDAERKRGDKRRQKREHAVRMARESTIREESDEDAMSVEDDFHRMDIRQRIEDPHSNGRGADRDRGIHRDKATGGGGGDRGAERCGEGIREKTGRRERNRRGNKENKKGQNTKTNQNNAGYHQSDTNKNRGVNDDDEVSGPSPVGGRQSGPRDKSELYRDHGEGVDRHAKYYNDPREPKSCNQRRNARAHDGEGDHYADEPKPPRREKKGRDRDRTRDRGKGGNGNDTNNRGENRRNRGNDKDDRRDLSQRDEERWPSDDKVEGIESRKHVDKDDRPGDHKEDRRTRGEDRDRIDRDNHRDSAGTSAVDKEDRAISGVTRGGDQRDREERSDRRERADRNERSDRRNEKGDNHKKGNQRERRENNRKKDNNDKDGEYRDGGAGGGAKARPPKISGGRSGGDRREDRASTAATKKDQPKVSKRYSDTRPVPLGKSKLLSGDGDDVTGEENSTRRPGDFDESPGETRASCHSREQHELRPIPRPSQKDDAAVGVKKIRNKFRPSLEIYKPGSGRKKSEPDREGKSSSPDPAQ
ncbi:regulator of nonsense transcripts 3A-like [Varroa jacobsoni]|uniref:regulator of nonsense transcripts 3A-like n=1 Tax=Varroa jacobsoni TaxID=62625 RepID=UPI000BF27CF7|nr:regulator of nonsense transcripts 3A-like [Varroa jacobsoni]